MLCAHRPAAVGVGAVRLVDVADAHFQLAAGVDLEAADVEIVAVDVGLLVVVVLAREHVAVLEVADLHLVDTKTSGALVPVVEVGDMDVVTLVEAAPGPQRTAIECRHVAPLGVHLVHPREAVIAGEFRRMTILVVELGHALDADHRAVIQAKQVLAQVQFDVLLALVAQAVLGLRARQLEALLRAAGIRPADTAAHITAELEGLYLRRGQSQCQQAGNADRTGEGLLCGLHRCS